jgi:hypothetical protein
MDSRRTELKTESEPLVPMSDPLGTAYARLREELVARVRVVQWPSPEAGFLYHLERRLGRGEGKAPTPTGERIEEGPVLASNGYLYADPLIPRSENDLRQWSLALDKLLLRDPFPLDRESYFFRPLELLGICVGARSSPQISVHARETLRNILIAGQARTNEQDLWNHSLASLAAWQLDVAWKRHSLPVLENLALDELCILRFLTTEDELCRESGLSLDPELLEKQILLECFTRSNRSDDPGRAAVVLAMTEQVVETRIVADIVRTRSSSANSVAAEALVEAIARRFTAFAKQLTQRHGGREGVTIKDEYDVQDLWHALLKLHFDDVRNEEWTPSYAGASSRIDFLLKREQIVVETKMTRKGLNQQGVVNELSIDIERYRSHPDCKTLICFVYDPLGLCKNPIALENDLRGSRGTLRISVYVYPKT